MGALAYNWLGQTLYFAGRVERGGVGRVGVWVYHTINDRVEEVFVGDSLLMGERLRLAVDPFRGYVKKNWILFYYLTFHATCEMVVTEMVSFTITPPYSHT